MNVNLKILCGLASGLLFLHWPTSEARAANAYPVITDINAGAQNFGASVSEFGGLYTLDDAASLNGNAVLSINQNGMLACCHGSSIEVSVSNGENGVTETAAPGHPIPPSTQPTPGVPNLDVNNAVPANSVFAAIGNPSGKLENGNVIRFSAWFRSDPANPITLDPQVQPILKIEYWKEALSGFADTNAQQIAPGFGDRVFDQDQQGGAIPIADLPHWVDLNGDGVVLDGSATVGNGRVTQVSTSEWRLATVTHTVNSTDWFGIGAEGFGLDDIATIESVKAVMFLGDFANTNLNGDGADGGNLLVDNILVEVFKDTASITANLNPNPSLSEGLPGDYNQNQTVDAADYTVWRNNLGSATALPNDSSAGVGQDDFDRWKANFGMTSPGAGAGSLGASAVPEPATLLLAMVTLMSSVVLHRRKR